MEDNQNKFKEKCINRAANIVWHLTAAVPSMAFIKSVSDNKKQFNELMRTRENFIFTMNTSRKYLWWMAHSDDEYKKFTEKDTIDEFLNEFGNNYIKDATLFINLLRELYNAKADSDKAKENKENKPVRNRRDGKAVKGTGVRSDDVGQHVASTSNSSTDA